MGIFQRVIAGGKTGHGKGQDIGTRQLHPIHRFARDDQRLSRIETTGHADHHSFERGAGEALHQSVDLDVVGLVTALIENEWFARDVWEAVNVALQANLGFRRAKLEWIRS